MSKKTRSAAKTAKVMANSLKNKKRRLEKQAKNHPNDLQSKEKLQKLT